MHVCRIYNIFNLQKSSWSRKEKRTIKGAAGNTFPVKYRRSFNMTKKLKIKFIAKNGIKRSIYEVVCKKCGKKFRTYSAWYRDNRLCSLACVHYKKMPDGLVLLKNLKSLYAVSNNGNIWSVRRYSWMKLCFNKKGYIVCGVKINGKHFNITPHREVAKHFVENYNSRLTVNHKDLNKKNNHYENLEMLTARQNINHWRKHVKKHRVQLNKP